MSLPDLRTWINPRWWRYLLTGCKGWRHFWCRARGHPYPVKWINLYGYEPDMRCTNCGEDTG